jgi:hypothetical protein
MRSSRCTRESARLAKIINAGWHQAELISAFASASECHVATRVQQLLDGDDWRSRVLRRAERC